MRVRIKQHGKYSDHYIVEKRAWWWPFWFNAFPYDIFQETQALQVARNLIDPMIVEVHK